MLSHYGNFIPKLTPFSITSMWLGMTGGGGAGTEDRAGFEVATWMDDWLTWRRARVVMGPSGAEKHAWDYPKYGRSAGAMDWKERYVSTLASMWQPYNLAKLHGYV